MNLHHLQLFLHIVHWGGISRAAGRPPFCIQTSALSTQMRLFEATLGVTLFHRQPFWTTPQGHRLAATGMRCIDELRRVGAQLANPLCHWLRLAAEESIADSFLPSVCRALLAFDPGLQLSLQSGPWQQKQQWLNAHEVDVVIAARDGARPPGLALRPLVDLPLGLIVPKASPLRSCDRLWNQRTIADPLVCPDPTEGVAQVFQRGLARGGIEWPVKLVVNSNATVRALVAADLGVGVGLDLPTPPLHPGVRLLPLPGFDRVPIVALWRPPDTTRLRPLVDVIAAEMARRLAASAGPDHGKPVWAGPSAPAAIVSPTSPTKPPSAAKFQKTKHRKSSKPAGMKKGAVKRSRRKRR